MRTDEQIKQDYSLGTAREQIAKNTKLSIELLLDIRALLVDLFASRHSLENLSEAIRQMNRVPQCYYPR